MYYFVTSRACVFSEGVGGFDAGLFPVCRKFPVNWNNRPGSPSPPVLLHPLVEVVDVVHDLSERFEVRWPGGSILTRAVRPRLPKK